MSKKKILIVDDEQKFVDMLKMRLEANEYEVMAAYDGEEGIRMAEDIKPDAIILDMLMPKMFGDEAAKKLKENQKTKDIPIVFLSAVPTEFLSGQEKQEGDNRQHSDDGIYLSKLSDNNELLAAIKKILKQ